MADADPVLSVRELTVEYRTFAGTVHAVRDISFDLHSGESLALIGESGCGKTTLGLALLRLLPKIGHVTTGSIRYRNGSGNSIDLLDLGREDLRRFRWNECAMVFQGAMNSLNPVMRVRDLMRDTARAHRGMRGKGHADPRGRSEELLRMVQLDPDRVLSAYPHELSGGMRQRVLIAMSLLLDPQVLIFDEPTTALDILTQRSIVDVLRSLRERLNFSMIFISHDLSLAAELADRVATMYAGRIVELGGVREAFYRPRHPYTVGLIKAVPPVTGELPEIASIPGSPPSLFDLPSGCAFRTRCEYATQVCERTDPRLEPVDGVPPTTTAHLTACHHASEVRLERKAVATGG